MAKNDKKKDTLDDSEYTEEEDEAGVEAEPELRVDYPPGEAVTPEEEETVGDLGGMSGLDFATVKEENPALELLKKDHIDFLTDVSPGMVLAMSDCDLKAKLLECDVLLVYAEDVRVNLAAKDRKRTVEFIEAVLANRGTREEDV